MLIVIPVSKPDQNLALELSKYINSMNDLKNHSLLVIFSNLVNGSIFTEIENNLSHICKNYYWEIMEFDESGWPISPNDMFKKTCIFIDESSIIQSFGEKCFYWMEVDNTPVRRFWADKMEEEYIRCEKKFMGRSIKTERWIDGKPTPDNTFYMGGTGIYPYPILPHIPEILDVNDIAFDIWIRHSIMQSFHETELIHWTWCSFDYKYFDDKIQGIPINIRGPLYFASAPPLTKECVISHGCKDGTLMNVMRNIKPYIFDSARFNSQCLSLACCGACK